MKKFLPIISSILAWLLAAFFLFGAYANTFISANFAATYVAWGYPDWFHYITGFLELTAALFSTENLMESALKRRIRARSGVAVRSSVTPPWRACGL